jgi:hypothetical protein
MYYTGLYVLVPTKNQINGTGAVTTTTLTEA